MKIFNMKIITRIILSLIIILALSLSAIGFLIYELKYTGDLLEEMYNTFLIANSSLEAEVNIQVIDNTMKDIMTAIREKDKEQIDLLIIQIEELSTSVSEKFGTVKKRIKDDKGKNLMVEVLDLSEKWKASQEEFRNQIKGEDYDEASSLLTGTKTNLEEFLGKLTEMDHHAGAVAAEFHAKAQSTMERVILSSLIIFIVLLSIVLLISLLLPRSIARSLSLFKEIFLTGSSGDLEVRYPVKEKARDEMNELGVQFNQFLDKVRTVIRDVIDTSNELGVSSEQLSVATMNFSDNAQNQAASSEEITASMEEISAGIDNVSDNSQFQFEKLSDLIALMKNLSDIIEGMAKRIDDAQSLSKTISDRASSGNESLQLMRRSMTKITESSDKVTDIIEMINDISERINLLSLNAAIEAARAGDAGRGFAVVADEISKLADQTATSISDIDSLIRENNDEINNGKRNVEDTIDSISQIIKGVESINEMMNQIFTNMEKQQSTNRIVNERAGELKIRSDEVRTATEEQRNAVSEVMKSITTINGLTQSSAAGAEEMTSNAGRLASIAEQLKNKVSFFKA